MKWLIYIFTLFLALSANAQVPPSKLVSAGVIMQAYRGDLSSSYDNFSGAFQASLILNKKEKWNGGFNLTIGTLTGQKLSGIPVSGSPQPNNFFKTSTISIHYDLRYNFISNDQWKAYLSLGFGLLRFNPKDQSDNNLQDLIDTRASNETYGNVTAMIPTQIGAMYFLRNGFGFNFQIGFMNSLTDYLDNISTLGELSGGDNALQLKFAFLVPLNTKIISD
jgi:hypothetical protein